MTSVQQYSSCIPPKHMKHHMGCVVGSNNVEYSGFLQEYKQNFINKAGKSKIGGVHESET